MQARVGRAGSNRWVVLGLVIVALGDTSACKGRGEPARRTPSTAESRREAARSEMPPAAEPARRPHTETGFPIPSAGQRLRAVGAGATLSPELDAAVNLHDSFEPIRAPEAGDWLAEHPESGQTYAQFVASRPNRPTAERRTIYFLPLGEFKPGLSPSMAVLRSYAGAFYQLPVRVLPAVAVSDIRVTTRKNELSGKRQLLSTDILSALKKRLPEDAYCLIALTQVDLYPEPSWNFVFGQASLRDRVGVYSFARYHPSFYGDDSDGDEARELVLRRSLKVMVHELGHMFGIHHCVWFQCVMDGSNSLAETDHQPLHLCPVELHKLVHSIGFSVLDRYRALRAFYKKHSLAPEAAWVGRRIAEIEAAVAGDRRPASE